MVNRDGFTVATKIRHNRKYNELPLVLVTSLASDQDKHRGAEADAIAYITKAGLTPLLSFCPAFPQL
ncbi:MAG TPA: hypothetical protein V6D12_08150 [Candidatus Obscuribacterales bacterium]